MLISDQIFEISVEDLKQNFLDGKWHFCRPEYYIRTGVDYKSIEEKKTALITTDADDKPVVEIYEALLFELDEETGEMWCLSGNTRIRSIFELLNSTETKGYEYRNVPYRIAREVTLEDAINYQVSTNDFTKPHNVYDIALKISELKPKLEESFKKKGLKPREAAGKATEQLIVTFKRTKQNISQLLTFINRGTELLKKYVAEGVISIDTSATLIQKAGGEKSKPEIIDNALSALYNQARMLTENESEVKIYKSNVIEYFKDLEAKAKQEEPDNDSGNDGESEDRKTPKGGNSGKPKEKISREEFVSDVSAIANLIYTIRPDDLSSANSKVVDELNIALMDGLKSTNELFPTDSSLSLFRLLREAYMQRIGDIERLSDSIQQSKDFDFADVRRVISKAASSSEKLYKALYEEPAKEEIPVATSEDIEIEEDELVTAQ